MKSFLLALVYNEIIVKISIVIASQAFVHLMLDKDFFHPILSMHFICLIPVVFLHCPKSWPSLSVLRMLV